jgi:multiple inositol-polyphosphate phosphatase / 2,3-bisphosphoglycerate 3-phosphatase
MFSEENVNIFEYAGDLSKYYQYGYGTPITFQMAVPLLKDFFEKMELVVNLTFANTFGVMRFAHAETVLPFSALLGIFSEDPVLSWDSPQNIIQNRVYRTSVISPFAANIAFLLYNCSSSSNLNDYRVKLLHNEMEILFPGDQRSCKNQFLFLKKINVK